MDWSLLVSAVAFLVSLGSLWYTHRADDRARRAEERAVRAEEREVEEAASRRRAKPVAVPKGGRGGRRAETMQYNYEVRNAGEGTLTELYLWHQTPEGEVVSTRAGGLMVLASGEDAGGVLSIDLRAPYPDVQQLWFEWVDEESRKVAFSGIVRSVDP